jgi:uncharacterized membrane protein
MSSNANAAGMFGLAAARLLLSLLAAAAGLAIGVGAGADWATALLVGWCCASGLFLGRVCWETATLGPPETRDHALRVDSTRAFADVVLLCACVISLGAVAVILTDASHRSGTGKGLLIALAVLSIAAAWACVHTTYTLRYARLYYTPPVGGIDFNDDRATPDYRDFAYVALTIGMTFQVSDTDLATSNLRRTAIIHALLSYLFGVVIIAITINIVASLLGR